MTLRSAADTMAYLKSLSSRPDKRVLTGQNLPNWESAADGIADYVTPLPAIPAILSTTALMGADDDMSFQTGFTDRLSQHLTSGGIVALEIHPANPSAPTGKRNISSAWVANAAAVKPDLRKLYTSAAPSALKSVWWAEVDRLVTFLNRLPYGATVIFRPFHEANGSYFWWGKDQTMPNTLRAAELVQLTTDLRDYVTPKVGVNILWAHSGNSLDWEAPTSFGRPTWVDIVGASLYSDTLTMPNKYADTYADLVATGKPIILFECGPNDTAPSDGTWDSRTIINVIRSKYPQVVGWQGWHDTGGAMLAPAENKFFTELYQDPWSVTLSDVSTPPASPYTAVHVLGTFPSLGAAELAFPGEHYISGQVS